MATSDPRRAEAGTAAEAPRLALTQVIDHAILDNAGRRAGRVDDLDIDIETRPTGEVRLILRGIVSGPLPRSAPRPMHALARACYRLLGVIEPHPTRIRWDEVTAINVFVHLDLDRDAAGLRAVDAAVRRRFGKLTRKKQ